MNPSSTHRFRICKRTNRLVHKSGLTSLNMHKIIINLFENDLADIAYLPKKMRHQYIGLTMCNNTSHYFNSRCWFTVKTMITLLLYGDNKDTTMYDRSGMEQYKVSYFRANVHIIDSLELDHILMLIKDGDKWLICESRIGEKAMYRYINDDDVDHFIDQYVYYKHTPENYSKLISSIREFKECEFTFTNPVIVHSYYVPDAMARIEENFTEILSNQFIKQYNDDNIFKNRMKHISTKVSRFVQRHARENR